MLLIPLLYLLTLARTPVLGDPTEYTFIANMLGIAHPPGYAFITVVGKLFQTLVPFGDVAWRMHLLSAVSGTWRLCLCLAQYAPSPVPHCSTSTFSVRFLPCLLRWW